MYVLVTGATGFLGSVVTQTALARGHEVVATTRRGSRINRLLDVVNNSHLHIVNIGDRSVDSVFEEFPIDAVVHTATHYGRGSRMASISQPIIDANISLPMSVLSSALQHGTKLFITTDTYFNKEDRTYNALQGYSLTKKYFLDWLQHHSDLIHVVNMRLEHIYGPFDSPNKFIPTMVREIGVEQVKEFAMTSGEQLRDFIYLTDAAEAFMLVLDNAANLKDPGYDYFEIGTGGATSIKDLASLVKRLSDSPTVIRPGELPQRADEILASVAGPAFHDAYGFTSETTLEDGILTLLGNRSAPVRHQ